MSNTAKTSGLAIASLILGILGLVTFGLLGLVGAILGIIALTTISGSNGALKGKGLATAGIIISACGFILGCIGLVALLMLPALAKARQHAMATVESSNLRQISVAMMTYAAEY